MSAVRPWVRRLLRFTTGAFVAFILLLGTYLGAIRPWHIRWGATDQEVQRSMPGDELFPDATLNTTRAITIQATPEEIWPWVVQMGNGRAGWYSYDRLDNGGRPSATRIIPELQRPLKVGEMLTQGAEGKGFKIMAAEENRYVVLGPQISWTLALYPQSDGSTRLVERLKAKYYWTPGGILFAGMLDVGDFIMMRKMLLNLKQRVEAQKRIGAPNQKRL